METINEKIVPVLANKKGVPGVALGLVLGGLLASLSALHALQV